MRCNAILSRFVAVVSIVIFSLVLVSCGGDSGNTGITQNPEDHTTKPAILGAISTSSTNVLVSFSKQMTDSAIKAANYVITQETVNPEVGTVLITGAEFQVDDHRSIVLHTSVQNEVTYRVTVVSVEDIYGNPLASKSVGANGTVTDPSSALFPGSAPGLVSVTFDNANWKDNNQNGLVDAGDVLTNADDIQIALVDDNGDGIVDNLDDINNNRIVDAGEVVSGLRDTDGDGLPDNVELSGTLIYVELSNGQFTTRQATSDPTKADTDGDGFLDLDEWSIGTDPRNRDSDNDGLGDYNEYNIVYSSPISQDTDGDGIIDGAEYSFYHTSPLLADTDGDKLEDGEELFELNRDPLVSDLPKIAVDVGDVRLQLDERYTYTDEQGNTVSQESSTSSSLANSQSSSYSHSDAGIFEWAADLSVRGGWSVGGFFGGGSEAHSAGVEVTASGHVGGSTSWQTDNTSAQESQAAYESSLNKGSEYSTTSTVTREVVGARIDLDLTVSNVGNVPFSVSNLEVTVLEPSPIDSGKLVPVATLVANSELITGTSLVVNLGPFNSKRGPFLFANREVFPNLVEALMRNPRGLVFRVANYDITDELGRNFAFSEQLARDRTASIVLDQGDAAAAVQYQVATSGTLDSDNLVNGGYVGGFNAATGKPLGLPLDYLLQARLGLRRHNPAQDIIVSGVNGSLESQGAMAGDDEIGTVDGVSIIAAGPNGWLETTPQGDDYVTNPTEQDGIVAGANKKADSIAQGDDIQLLPVGTTGLSVSTVVIGAGENGVLDTQVLEDDKPEFVTGYETSRTCSATSQDAGDTCRLDSDCVSVPNSTPASCTGPQRLVRVNSLRNGDYNRAWFVLTDDEVPAAANFGEIVVKPGKNLTLGFLQDLDKDGLFARSEFLYGSIDSSQDVLDNSKFGISFDETALVTCPSGNTSACDSDADSKDTDRDGIGDYAEVNVGWKVSVDGGPLRQVYSNPRVRDSDGDGLEDFLEADLRSACRANDPRTDGLCAFLNPATPVRIDQAIYITNGVDGVTQSVAGDTNGDGLVDNTDGPSDDRKTIFADFSLFVGYPVIDTGPNGKIETALRGDDFYVSSSFIPPATDPSNGDTDLDGVDDYTELDGYDIGLAIIDGGNGLAETARNGDDVQRVPENNPVTPGGIVVLPGVNGIIDTGAVGVGDDLYNLPFSVIVCGVNLNSDTVAIGDDVQNIDYGTACNSTFGVAITAGANGVLDTLPNWRIGGGDDHLRRARSVTTDPLRRDTDNDTNSDGFEITLGSDPTIADGDDFRDGDRDGLTDNEESQLGWTVTANGGAPYVVKSSPSLIDTDGDGLPDIIERDLRTDPNKVDTDGDGISDFDEVQDFARFVRLVANYPSVVINGFDSARYGTDPLKSDTDGDGLSDYKELIEGTPLTLPGDSVPRIIFTSPVNADSDADTAGGGPVLTDLYELVTSGTDPNNNDTDGDGRTDGSEISVGSNPLVPDIAVTLTFERANILNPFVGDGANGVNEMTWWFTTKGPGDVYPQILTNPHTIYVDQFGYSSGNWAYGAGTVFPDWASVNFPLGSNYCALYPMDPGTSYSLNLVNSSRTFILQPGQSFQLNGLVGEIDTVSSDCGHPPYYIPSSIIDVQGCVLNINKVFTYEELASASGTQVLSASATSNASATTKCTADMQYSVTRQ